MAAFQAEGLCDFFQLVCDLNGRYQEWLGSIVQQWIVMVLQSLTSQLCLAVIS